MYIDSLHLQEDGPEGLDAPAKDAQKDRGTQDHPYTSRIEGTDHDQDRQEGQHQIDFGDALDDLIHPTAIPRANGSDDDSRDRNTQGSQQPEGKGNRRSPQQGDHQITAVHIRPGQAIHLSMEDEIGIDVRTRFKGRAGDNQSIFPLQRHTRIRSLGPRISPA